MHGFALKAILTSIVALTTTPIGPMAVFASCDTSRGSINERADPTRTRVILTRPLLVSLGLIDPKLSLPYFRKARRPALYQQNDVRLRGA